MNRETNGLQWELTMRDCLWRDLFFARGSAHDVPFIQKWNENCNGLSINSNLQLQLVAKCNECHMQLEVRWKRNGAGNLNRSWRRRRSSQSSNGHRTGLIDVKLHFYPKEENAYPTTNQSQMHITWLQTHGGSDPNSNGCLLIQLHLN